MGLLTKIGAGNAFIIFLLTVSGLLGYGWYTTIKTVGGYEQELVHLKARAAEYERQREEAAKQQKALDKVDARIDALINQHARQFDALRRDIRGVLTNDKEAAEWGATDAPVSIIDRLCAEGLADPSACVRPPIEVSPPYRPTPTDGVEQR